MNHQPGTRQDAEEEPSRAGRRLRAIFLACALTDGLALVPLLHPGTACLIWGLQSGTGGQRFAAHSAAALMAGWTLLLWWASRKPMERRDVAPLTLVVLVGLVLAEIAAAMADVVPAARMIPTWILQVVLIVMLSGAYVGSRAAGRRL